MTGSRTRDPRRLALLAAATLTATLLAPSLVIAATVTIAFVSDTTWTVTDADPTAGPALTLPADAQKVCLNALAPVDCPAGATLYGWPGSGWEASLESIPGAAWIWAPGIDGSTTPADSDAYDFTKVIDVPGTPTGGTLYVAADDIAFAYVNGTYLGDAVGQGALTAFDIGDALVPGENEIMIRAQNFAICPGGCAYDTNPAGTVFGGSITFEASNGGDGSPPPNGGDGSPPPNGGDGSPPPNGGEDDGEPQVTPPSTSIAGELRDSAGDSATLALVIACVIAIAVCMGALGVMARARSRTNSTPRDGG